MPLTVAFGSMIATFAPPPPPPSAVAVASIVDTAVIEADPVTTMLQATPPGVVPAAGPTCASTIPLTTAVASAPWPASPPTEIATVVASASRSAEAETTSVVPVMSAPSPA